jgi:signal transduction histidine kinase/FixJ family two-component response regulator
MTNKIGSEIKIMGYIIVIFLIITITGVLAYKGFRSIIAEVSHSSEPDTKLSLMKQIVSDISEAENNVKSYNLTRDKKYLSPFYNSVLIIDRNINELKQLTKPNRDQEKMVLQMEALIDKKYNVLNELLSLYPDENITNELMKISERINKETELINDIKTKQDEISEEKVEERKSFFQRLFGKSDKSKPDSIALVSEELKSKAQIKQIENNIRTEIEKVNQQHLEQQKLIKQQEFRLTSAGKALMTEISAITASIETIEKKIIVGKIDRAAILANETNRMVAVFCLTASLLLVIVSIVLVKYVQKKKAYEIVLKQGKDQAEALARSKEMFLANMSHEIRTPMNAITGFTNQILKTELQPEQRDQLKIVQRSNEHLLRIVNDILDYSKIQAGKFSFDHVSFSPDKVMHEAVELLKPLVKNKNVKLIYNITGTMPEFVVGDPVRLKQILFNLLGNSIKFTNEGEIAIKTEFEKDVKNQWNLHLIISDTGIGIPESKLVDVFNEFHQATNDISYKYGGTGLGLPITKKLVELQNGSIDVKSEDGKGTTISIIIPYNESTSTGIYYKQNGKPVVADEMQLKSLKVLIADDDEYNRKLLNVILRKWNADVREARNGKEVIEEISKNPFDILLLDIRMPEMNGIEAAQLIRKMKDSSKSETPIIALTAVTTEEKKQRCKNAGINDFLSKPFKEEDLFKKIIGLTGYSATYNNTYQENISIMKHNKMFNLDELKQVSNGDKKFLEEMIAIFIRTTDEGINDMELAIKQNNMKAIADLAHKIAPPCRHMGATSLLTCLTTIENAIRKSDNAVDIKEWIEKAKKEKDELINELKTEII